MNIPFRPELCGKVAVVTGGAGVLCREFAKALALCGAKVAILNRTLSKAEKVVEEIIAMGGEAIAVQVDVTTRKFSKSWASAIFSLTAQAETTPVPQQTRNILRSAILMLIQSLSLISVTRIWSLCLTSILSVHFCPLRLLQRI